MTLVCMLVNVGCDLDKQNRWGATALHLAAELGRLDIVQVLVEAGADVQIKNEEGLTAIDVAKTDAISNYLIDGS